MCVCVCVARRWLLLAGRSQPVVPHCQLSVLSAPQAKCLKVKLFSEANTGYFYTWKKNPKAYPWRIALRKYDPIVRRHVLFKVCAHASTSHAACC